MSENKKQALIITFDGYQDQELIYPYHRLKEEDFDVTIIANLKNSSSDKVTGINGIKFKIDYYLDVLDSDDDFDHCSLLILVGGVKSLEKLRQQQYLINFIDRWNRKNKLIGSICHGAQLLISARSTKEKVKVLSGYYSIKDDITNGGFEYSAGPVANSGNVVSSPHYDFMGKWMLEVVKEYNKKHGENL